MTTCSAPPTINGGSVVSTGPYYNGSSAVYQCSAGYLMNANSYITCDGTNWVGTNPSCSAQDRNDLDFTLNQTDEENLQSWLAYIIAAVCILLALLVITCIVAVCCYMCGYGFGYGEGRRLCCRKNQSYDINHQNLCKNFPRRFFYDQKGRRFHINDIGHRCYKDHHSKDVNHAEYDESNSNGSTVVTVSEVNLEKSQRPVAKDVVTWKPHSNPVRNINTSTK
ncbi:hypothetical protein ACF0H5_013953 [Mactra antiquata]